MILSRFFKPKWQHKERDVRIECIAELNPSDPQDQNVLKNLVSKDDSLMVRKAALLKLDNIDTWLDCYQQHKDAATREFSLKQLLKHCQPEHWQTMSSDFKKRLIEQGIVKPVVEELISLEEQIDIINQMLLHFGKPHFINQVILKSPNAQVKTELLAHIDDVNTLEKLVKKSSDDNVKSLIKNKLELLIEAKEKPVRVLKQANLLLAKYQALRDNTDYQLMSEKREEIVSQWHQLDLECLNLTEQEELKQKYEKIANQIASLFAAQYEKFKQDEIAQKAETQKQAEISDFNQALKKITQKLTDAVFNNAGIDEQGLESEIKQLMDKIQASLLDGDNKKLLLEKSDSLLEKLKQIPVVAEAVSAATQIISKLSGIRMPKNLTELNERSELYFPLAKEFKLIRKKTENILPDSINRSFDDFTTQWQKETAVLTQQQNKLFQQTQRKLAELKKLISSGKYYAAFGLHKKLNSNFEQISPFQQQKLQHLFDAVNEQISELSDWDAYIATPRKQALLNSAKELLANSVPDVQQLAAEVKHLRKQWNSLGHAEEVLDEKLNEEFNQVLEAAFAPCREYFAQMEQEREQHLSTRLNIIKEAQEFASSIQQGHTIDFKQLDAELNRFISLWKSGGEVPRSRYQELAEQFNHAIKPLKDMVKNQHKLNAQAKEKLVKQAQLLQESTDNVEQAIEQLKQMQQQWKDIGYAGIKVENSLWHAFRTANDLVFKQRDAKQSAIAAENQERAAQLASDFEQLKARTLDSVDCLQTAISDAKSLLTKLNELKQDSAVKDELIAYIQQCELFYQKKIKQEKSEHLTQVFNLFKQLCSGALKVEDLENLTEFQNLTNQWQKHLLSAAMNSDDENKRQLVMLQLEIIAGVDSPSELQHQRMEEKVSLLSEKLNQSELPKVEDKLVEWLSCGLMPSPDEVLFSRLNKVIESL